VSEDKDKDKEGFEHYFVRDPAVPSAPVTIRAQLRGRRLSFKTDRGVFSHGSVDFGTRTLAEAIKIPPGARVLDLGCGYGVLGIVAKLLAADSKVTMVDVNARACALASENAETNRAGDVEVVCGDAAETLAVRMFDAILLNPPVHAGRAAVLALLEFAAGVLDRGGKLWCVIQTSKGARRYAGDLEQWFDTVETVRIERGYRIIVASGAKAKE
jgi:16S rRNA (guanine1207-N2)-methyltransferase